MIHGNKQSNNNTNYIKSISKILSSTTLIGSLLLSGSAVSASDLSASQKGQVTIASVQDSKNSVQSAPTTKKPAVTSTPVVKPKGQVVAGMTVRYGFHTYGSTNQAEYDKVMEIVDNAIKDIDSVQFGGKYSEYYEDFLNGERWSGDKRDRSDRNVGLKFAENSIGELLEAGVSKQDIIKAYNAAQIVGKLTNGKLDPRDGSPRSAYDDLVRNVSDCDSLAQVYSAVFDALGFNTMIVAGNGHADVAIQIGGHWFETGAGSFMKVDVAHGLEKGGYIYSYPTYGSPY